MAVYLGPGGSSAERETIQTQSNVAINRNNSALYIYCSSFNPEGKESSCYLEEAQELWRKHLGDGGEFAMSDLVPFVSVGGKRLRP